MRTEFARALRSLTERLLCGAFGVACALSAAASDLDTRIEQARELSVTDPTASGLDLLRELETEGEGATARQRTEIELIMIRTLGLQGDFDQALDRVLALTERDLEIDQHVSALRLGANVAMNAGQFELAFAQLSGALSLLDEIDSPKNEVGVFGLASFFHSRSGDTWLAVDYADQAVESARLAADTRLECAALGWLAQAHAAQGNQALAQQLGLEGANLCEQANDDVTHAFIANLLARLAIKSGQLDDAASWVDKAAELGLGNYSDGQIESRLIRARLMLLNGELESGLAQYQNLIDQLQSDLRIERLAEALDGAAEAATRLGDLESAVAFHKQHVEVRGRHLERTRSLSMAQLSMEFERKQKEQEIRLLQEQQRFSELSEQNQAQRERLTALIWITGLLLAAFLLAWLLHALRERRHFRQLSDRDGLTQLFNHTRFFKQLDHELSRRRDQSLILIMADIDHFKKVNDRFGHQIGDEVLRHTARLLSEVFGDQALIGRIGGEEFAIRLLGTTQQQAVDQTQSILDRLAGHNRKPTDPPITLSFGLALALSGESLESLRERTDNALYRAKKKGRNRAVVAKP